MDLNETELTDNLIEDIDPVIQMIGYNMQYLANNAHPTTLNSILYFD